MIIGYVFILVFTYIFNVGGMLNKAISYYLLLVGNKIKYIFFTHPKLSNITDYNIR